MFTLSYKVIIHIRYVTKVALLLNLFADPNLHGYPIIPRQDPRNNAFEVVWDVGHICDVIVCIGECP